MRKIIMILLVALIATAGIVNAAPAIVYGISGGEDVTLDIGESHTYYIDVVGATGTTEKFVVKMIDATETDASGHFGIEVTGYPAAVFGSDMIWAGPGAKSFEVKITNNDAPNGEYQVQFENTDSAAGKISRKAYVTSNITGIPEFPTVALPVAAILGLAFVFMRRKE